ncbi:MAG: hypothetical protein WEB58_22050 [Planctomycetaceae bacterium]
MMMPRLTRALLLALVCTFVSRSSPSRFVDAKVDDDNRLTLPATDVMQSNARMHPDVKSVDVLVLDDQEMEISEAKTSQTILLDVIFEMDPTSRFEQGVVFHLERFSQRHKGWVIFQAGGMIVNRDKDGTFRPVISLKCPDVDGQFYIRGYLQGEEFVRQPLRIVKK